MAKSIEISESELEVMQVIWECSPVTAKSMLQKLENKWQLTTLNTFLNRLVKKGALSYSKIGREYMYEALIDKDHYVTQASQHFLKKIFGGQLSPMVAHFSEQQSLKREDIEALKKLIDEWEEDNE